jgi:hypothetical protein
LHFFSENPFGKLRKTIGILGIWVFPFGKGKTCWIDKVYGVSIRKTKQNMRFMRHGASLVLIGLITLTKTAF